MTDWTNISISSIYRVLSGLQDKGLIETTLEHEGQALVREIEHGGERRRQCVVDEQLLLQDLADRRLGQLGPELDFGGERLPVFVESTSDVYRV